MDDCRPTLSEILRLSFFVPGYQRGYRWQKTQVEDLLYDISGFSPREVGDTGRKTWYCLQPVVVKRRNVDQSGMYELIDGQQRITTIFLIGHYINEMWRGKEKDPEPEIHYESRLGVTEFLKGLNIDQYKNVNVDDLNIDFFHIFTAYKTINEWVKSQYNFQKDQFIANFLNHVRVIWYETFEDDPISIFTRINMGKIPLTNAELIKAHFLNSSNFSGDDDEKIYLKQLEIAGQWDSIEAALHDPEFWYFLTDGKDKSCYETRIDFIFDMLTKAKYENDPYAVFREYTEDFKKEQIINKWHKVKRCYQTLREWFSNRVMYHKIGYLIATGASVKVLMQEFNDSLSKNEFLQLLDNKIKETLPQGLDSLSYGSNRVRNVLLLHNILTMLSNTGERTRFPFDRYKNENWNVEHIHSVQEEMPKTREHQRKWLEDTRKYIEEECLQQKIDEYLRIEADVWNSDEFKDLFEKAVKELTGNEEVPDINEISNLTLLDQGTNCGYKNAVFPVKRSWIIEREKKGIFVPVCTKNVFMKFYSEIVNHLISWDHKDRESYYDHMENTLNIFLRKSGQ